MRAFVAAAALVLTLAGSAAAGTAKPRVLAIRFGPDLEVNPVTQDYLTSKLSHAATSSQVPKALAIEGMMIAW